MNPDRGGNFWVGAGFASGGKSGVKIYINGKERCIQRAMVKV